MLRRGTKTSNAIWGNKASILVGDYLLSTAFQLMVKSKSLKALDLLSHASKVMSDGEVMQLMNSTNINISKQQYIQIISQKTAILFAAATSVGAIISKADKKQEKALHDFGINLGITFQITDDILDYSSNQITFGKEIGNDFYEGKVTLPIIITYDKATQIEKNRIKKIFSQALMSKDKNQDLLSEMMCLIKKYNALALSIEESKSYHLKAIDNLSVFDDSKEKEMLISIINYVVTREK
jgi:octaprenyl-diphosphate synthase